MWIKDVLTGIDNQTHDIGRHALFIGIVTFVFCTVWTVVKGGPFDYQAFGIGFGALCAGGGAGIALKSKTEPGGGA